jgi:hypothetical protein
MSLWSLQNCTQQQQLKKVQAMTAMTDLAGYPASTMVLLTFMTKDMRLLRVLAIISNIAFITYGVLAWLPPVFCLHLLLLPVNVLRLRSLLAEEGLPAARSHVGRLSQRFLAQSPGPTRMPVSPHGVCRMS